MVLSFLFYTFLAYLAYKIIFGLVIPMYRTTRRVKRAFREMQEQMNGGSGSGERRAQGGRQGAESTTYNKGADPGDYIEFEEVK